ncbi:MAG TPA: aldehyde dehydrogenase family protein, partial [Steroidobacteraceae bacterium]|nr:aldehyde dehydrogenase family protein [Steroidobacteraceae bacterium]
MQTQLLIGGRLVGGEGPPETVLDAASGATIATVAAASVEQVGAAVAAAQAAFDGWAGTAPRDRATLLLKIADGIEREAAAYASLESRNTGKPLAAMLNDEMPSIADVFRYFAGACRIPQGLAAGEYLPGHTSMIRRDPVGVVGSIAPWNYPLMMAVWKVGPALAAGNTVVLKPSEQTPLTSLRLMELAGDIFPPGVFNVITGHGEPVGAGLVRHPKVNMVSLTGDVATGKEVARTAAASLKKVHLELGGKAPVIIFDDADMELVVPGIKMAGFANSGQDCTAACRLYASERVYDRLLG